MSRGCWQPPAWAWMPTSTPIWQISTTPSPQVISQGTLFRIEAAVAALAALLVLVWHRVPSDAFAWLVAAGGLALLLIYRYIDVGKLGPVPNMYEPVWFTDKKITVVAQAVTIVTTSFLLLTRTRRGPRRAPPLVRVRGRRRAGPSKRFRRPPAARSAVNFSALYAATGTAPPPRSAPTATTGRPPQRVSISLHACVSACAAGSVVPPVGAGFE